MSDSLSDAIAASDDQATILDDRLVLEDRAILQWLRRHELDPKRYGTLVIGYDPLPADWAGKAMRFYDRTAADAFVARFRRDSHAILTLKRLLASCNGLPSVGVVNDAAILQAASTALLYRRMWALQATAMANSKVGKTDPKVFQALNPKFGTQIDFAYIAKLEGDQWLRGYVPMRNGVVIGNSGMTIASGFDIGQWTASELTTMGFAKDLLSRLTPFCAHPFKGKTKAEVAAAVAKLAPVPEVTKAEADQIDGVVFSTILTGAIGRWDRLRSLGVPDFRSLPGGWQTVWLSRNYQEGGAPQAAAPRAFRKAALEGRWRDAIRELKAYPDYKDRAAQEATKLESQLPPDPPKPQIRPLSTPPPGGPSLTKPA